MYITLPYKQELHPHAKLTTESAWLVEFATKWHQYETTCTDVLANFIQQKRWGEKVKVTERRMHEEWLSVSLDDRTQSQTQHTHPFLSSLIPHSAFYANFVFFTLQSNPSPSYYHIKLNNDTLNYGLWNTAYHNNFFSTCSCDGDKGLQNNMPQKQL